MRRILSVLCLAPLVAGCHSPQSASASATSGGATGDGKISITTHSDEARALFLRGRALSENLQVHAGHAAFAQAVAIDPSFAMGEYYLATTAPTAKELSAHLQKALALAPGASLGEQLLIRSLEARTHADRALLLQLAESLVVHYPLDERAHLTLAAVYSAQQMHDKAIGEYQEAIAINPRYSLAYNQLGYAYRSVNKLDSAESVFTRYIALVPNDPNPYDSYAELLMKMGRFDESIAQYRKALSIDRHFGGSYVGIATDQMLAGRYPAAIAEAEQYVDSARDDGERRTALLNKAMIHVDHGATDEALQAMRRSYGIASAIGDTTNMSADGIVIADIQLAAHRVDDARDRYLQSHDLVAASSLPAAVKEDNELARHYDIARVAIAEHDLHTARAEASAYLSGAAAKHNDARMRQARELNGLVALEARDYPVALTELALAEQDNPAVIYTIARAYAGEGFAAKAKVLSARAEHLNILPTLPYVFTRAEIAGATRLAIADNVRETPR